MGGLGVKCVVIFALLCALNVKSDDEDCRDLGCSEPEWPNCDDDDGFCKDDNGCAQGTEWQYWDEDLQACVNDCDCAFGSDFPYCNDDGDCVNDCGCVYESDFPICNEDDGNCYDDAGNMYTANGDTEPMDVKVVNCGNAENCGGGPSAGDIEAQISCTSFPVKTSDTGSCTYQVTDDINMPFYTGSPTGAQAWQASGADDFFVFHGCDGAGLQTDCKGDLYYVEQYGPECQWGDPGCEGDLNSNDLHNVCPFIHPGTGITYQWYNCGWWGDGEDWADGKMPWSPNNGLAPYTLKGPSGNMFLYPWVCHQNPDRDFSYFGVSDPHLNCFCDNEPLDDTSTTGDQLEPPPTWFVYTMEVN